MARTKAEGGISGLQKAAILLIALGPERSAGIFKHLKEEEIEELTLEIANTRSVTPQIKEEVINEFYEVCLAQQYIAEGGINYAKELLEKALGSDKAMDVIGKLTASLQVKPFEFVRKTDASQLINFIQDEHPQTIALILSYLSPSQAALIISALPPDSQAEVARRIAVMDRTSPDVIKEVEKVLESKLASLVNQDYTIIGGVDAVVDILNTVDRGTEKHIMETLEIEEPELADEIRKKMFVFEDILLLDDKAIQRVLRDVDNNDLAVALKGANEQVQNAIFNNLSKRLVVMIKEDMEFMGPVRMKDVEEAQQKIVNIIRKLEAPVTDPEEEKTDFTPSGNVIKAGEDLQKLKEDAEAEAQKIVEDARAQAESILQDARSQAEAERADIQEAARRQGQQEAQAEADRAEAAREAEYQKKTAGLEAEYQKRLDELEPEFVDTITGIYEHIFHVDLHSYREVLCYLISTTMRKTEDNRSFLIHVSKEDYPYVSMQKKQISAGAAAPNATVEIVKDITLGKGECLIETEGGIFDCGLGTQLSELRQKLKLLSYEG